VVTSRRWHRVSHSYRVTVDEDRASPKIAPRSNTLLNFGEAGVSRRLRNHYRLVMLNFQFDGGALNAARTHGLAWRSLSTRYAGQVADALRRKGRDSDATALIGTAAARASRIARELEAFQTSQGTGAGGQAMSSNTVDSGDFLEQARRNQAAAHAAHKAGCAQVWSHVAGPVVPTTARRSAHRDTRVLGSRSGSFSKPKKPTRN